MVPSSTGAVLVFVLLVAPGLLFDLLSARRHAGVPESTFREASRVVLASAAFTTLAALVTLCVLAPFRSTLPDLGKLLAEPSYRAEHTYAVVLGFAGVSLTACGLAYSAHAWLGRKTPGRLRPESAWHRAFRGDVPSGTAPFVRVRMSNGSTYLGHVGYFTPALEAEGRELALVPPLWSGAPGQSPSPMPSEWQRIIVKGEDVVAIMVRYAPHPAPDGPRPRRWRAARFVMTHVPGGTGSRRAP